MKDGTRPDALDRRPFHRDGVRLGHETAYRHGPIVQHLLSIPTHHSPGRPKTTRDRVDREEKLRESRGGALVIPGAKLGSPLPQESDLLTV